VIRDRSGSIGVSFKIKDTFSSIRIDPDPLQRHPDRSPRPTALIRIDCGGATAAATAVAGRIDKPLKTGCIGIFFHTTLWNFHWIPQPRSDRQDRLDLQELLVVTLDSVPLAASIQQPRSLIRIAGTSCIGIFHATLWNFLEAFSRRITAPVASILERPRTSKVY